MLIQVAFDPAAQLAVQNRLAELAAQYPKEALGALYRQAEYVMTDSKKNYCPVDLGTLRSSGHVLIDEENMQVILGYGGPAGTGNVGETNDKDVGYAVIQHEVPMKHTVGEDKYLEKPLFARLPFIPEKMAADVQRRIK